MAVEQQTTVNHISVNKEEIKTLVNRRKTLRQPTTSPPFLFLSLFHGSPSTPRLLPFLCYFALFFLVTLSPPSGGRLLCCSVHGHWKCIAHKASVCLSVTLNSAMSCRTLNAMRMGAHVSAVGNPVCFCLTVRSEY